MSLLSTLTSVILPVLSIAGVGFVLGRVKDVDVDSLSTVTIYVLVPALVFSSLATSSLGGSDATRIVAGVVGYTLLMALVGEGVARAVGETGPIGDALVLVGSFPNAGNYGIPLSAFAFGAMGRSTAILFLSTQSILTYTVGVYLASRGTTEGRVDALKGIFTLPLLYAVLAAGLARMFGVVPPAESAVMRTLALTGDAAIPVMLLMLGIQLSNTSYGATLSRIRVPATLRLVVAPVVAIGLALALGFAEPTVARTFVLECAMPAAVMPFVLMVEFHGEGGAGISPAEYVSTAIMVSTLLSIPTLAILIAVLQSGVVL